MSAGRRSPPASPSLCPLGRIETGPGPLEVLGSEPEFLGEFFGTGILPPQLSLRVSFSANRVTEKTKTQISLSYDISSQKYRIESEDWDRFGHEQVLGGQGPVRREFSGRSMVRGHLRRNRLLVPQQCFVQHDRGPGRGI